MSRICTPPGTHAQIAAAAASAAQGRWVAVSEVTGPPAG
jgi:hypothetical protein